MFKKMRNLGVVVVVVLAHFALHGNSVLVLVVNYQNKKKIIPRDIESMIVEIFFKSISLTCVLLEKLKYMFLTSFIYLEYMC